ncbi:MAG: hypothetical protein IIB28_11505 [Chloroflexi bacterium]|nr:hypothetical protein [Chloroflexota bacterium]
MGTKDGRGVFIHRSLMSVCAKFTPRSSSIADHAGMKRVRGDTGPRPLDTNTIWRQIGFVAIGAIALVWLGSRAIGG